MSFNVNVVASAKEEYLELLKIHLTPLIQEGFISLYEDAKNAEETDPKFEGNHLMRFQTFLTDIPDWNQTILENETARILDSLDTLTELIGAIFLLHIKILSSIKIGGSDDKINITVPDPDVFIHCVYYKAAKIFYYNPYLFIDYENRDNSAEIKDMLDTSIVNTINSLIPYKHVLREYLSSIFSKNVKDSRRVQEKQQQQQQEKFKEPRGLTLSGDDMGLGYGSDFKNIGSGASSSCNNIDFNESFGTNNSGKNDIDSFLEADPFNSINDEPTSSNPFPESDPFSDTSALDKTPSFFPGISNETESMLDNIISGGNDTSPSFRDDTESLDSFREIGNMPDQDPFSSSTENYSRDNNNNNNNNNNSSNNNNSNENDKITSEKVNIDTDPFGGSSSDFDPFKESESDNLFTTSDNPFGSVSDDIFSQKEKEINFKDLE